MILDQFRFDGKVALITGAAVVLDWAWQPHSLGWVRYHLDPAYLS